MFLQSLSSRSVQIKAGPSTEYVGESNHADYAGEFDILLYGTPVEKDLFPLCSATLELGLPLFGE
jgi:hypothetical protein